MLWQRVATLGNLPHCRSKDLFSTVCWTFLFTRHCIQFYYRLWFHLSQCDEITCLIKRQNCSTIILTKIARRIYFILLFLHSPEHLGKQFLSCSSWSVLRALSITGAYKSVLNTSAFPNQNARGNDVDPLSNPAFLFWNHLTRTATKRTHGNGHEVRTSSSIDDLRVAVNRV